jgi:hypothetical protein
MNLVCGKHSNDQLDKLLLPLLLDLNPRWIGLQPQPAVIMIDALNERQHGQDVRNKTRLLPILRKFKAARSV